MSLSDLVTFQNADTDPFQVIYDNKSYGLIAPGQTKTYPRYLYEHVDKHLIDQILNRLGIATNNAAQRALWHGKIFVKEEALEEPMPLTQQERDYQNIQQSERNSTPRPPDPLERAVATHMRAGTDVEASGVLPELDENGQEAGATSAPQPATALTPEQIQAKITELQSLLTRPQPEVVPPVDVPVEHTEPAVALNTGAEGPSINPERQVVLDWAKNNMSINVDDPKTSAAFSIMSLQELKEAVQYEG